MEQTNTTVNLNQIVTLFIIELVCNDNINHLDVYKIDKKGEFYKQVLENLSFDKTIRQFVKTFNKSGETNLIEHFNLYGVFNRELDNIYNSIEHNALKFKDKKLNTNTNTKINTNIVFNSEYKTIVQIIISIILDISCNNTFEYLNCTYDIYKNRKPNPFMDMIMETHSIDYAINEFVKTLFSDKKFIKVCQLYETKLTDRSEKDIYLENKIVTTIISHFGLYEVFNLNKTHYDLVHNKIINALFIID